MFATMVVHTKYSLKSSQRLRYILLWCRHLFPVNAFSDITIQKSPKTHTSGTNFQGCTHHTFDPPCEKILHSRSYFCNFLLHYCKKNVIKFADLLWLNEFSGVTITGHIFVTTFVLYMCV